MRHWKRMLAVWCGVAIFFAGWLLTVRAAGNLGELGSSVGLRYSDGRGLTMEQMDSARESASAGGLEFPETALWSQSRRQELSDSEKTRFLSADVLLAAGNPELILPVRYQSGSGPSQGDTSGCAVSGKMALALWGSENAVGNRLLWNGREYIVRGVFHSPNPLVLVQADSNKNDLLFSGIEMGTGASMQTPSDASNLLGRYGLPAPDAFADTPLAAQAAAVAAALPGILLAAAALLRLLGGVWAVRRYPALCALASLVTLVLACLLIWGALPNVALPMRFIPAMWSDFSFWQALWADIAASFTSLFALAPSFRELLLIQAAAACAGACLLSLFALSLLAGKLHASSEKGLYVSLAACLLLVFLLSPLAGNESLPRACWLALPGWYAADLLRQKWQLWLLRQDDPVCQTEPGKEDGDEALVSFGAGQRG